VRKPGIAWRRHGELLRGEGKHLAWGALGLLGVDLLDLLPPVVLALLVDQALGKKAGALSPVHLGLAYIGLVVLQNAFRFPMRMGFLGASLRMAGRVRERYGSHLLGLSRVTLGRFTQGDLISRATTDLEAVERGIGMGLLFFLDSAFYLLAIPPTLLAMSPALALLALLPLPLVGAWAYFLIARIGKATEALSRAAGAMNEKAIENARAAETVRAFGIEEWQSSQFTDLATDTMEKNLKLALLEAGFGTSLQVLVSLGTLALLVLGGEQVLGRKLSTGWFVAFLQYAGMMAWPLTGLSWGFVLLRKSSESLARIDEILTVAPEGEPKETEMPPALAGSIEVRTLTYSPPGEKKPRLEQVSFRIRPGERVALVGSVGSGKSTLLDLLSGYLEPPPGTIFLDGRDLRTIPRPLLRQHVAVVPEESFLFSGTVRENIRLGLHEAPLDDHKIGAAASSASLDARAFPLGLEAEVTPEGKSLSGGERQRVSLARALYRNAPLLILDNATSAVDLGTEEHIFGHLKALTPEKTLLIATHRLSRIKDVHRILVLDEGKLVEEGTEAELLARNGVYAALAGSQPLEEAFDQP